MKKIIYSRWRFLCLVFSGALTGLTLVLPEIGFFEWITLIPICMVVLRRATDREVKLRSLYFDGLVAFYSFYLVCYHWFIYLYPLEFINGMTKGGALAVVCVAWFGLSLLQALMGGLVFLLAGVLLRSRACENLKILAPLVFSGLWAVFEWTQTIGWWGVPWGRLPIGQTEFAWGIQNASCFGSYFITFVLVAVNSFAALALLSLNEERFVRLCASVAATFVVFQYASGAFIYFTTPVDAGTKIRVACVQGNISSAEKWNESGSQQTLDTYMNYLAMAVDEGAELIVLPETAFPYDLTNKDGKYSTTFSGFTAKHGVYLIVGAYVSDEDQNSYNALICFTPEGEQLDTVYSKRHLVPFGEYVPMRPVIETLIPPLAELVLSNNDVTAGEGAQIINIYKGNEISLGSLICFDSIYDELTLESVREGAELICLATNDSWFTDSAALYMHNAQAQLRAVESGRYVARAANTGISTVIDPHGDVLESLPPLVGGIIVQEVYASNARTIYSYIGNSFVYFSLGCFVLLFADNLLQKYKKSTKTT